MSRFMDATLMKYEAVDEMVVVMMNVMKDILWKKMRNVYGILAH